jgi:hypothetical protein
MKLKMEFAGHTIVSSFRARCVEGIWLVPPEEILSGLLVPNDPHTFDKENGYAIWFAIDPHRVDAFEVTS